MRVYREKYSLISGSMKKIAVCMTVQIAMMSAVALHGMPFISYADRAGDMYISVSSSYYQVKGDMNGYSKIDWDTYQSHLKDSDTYDWNDPVQGIDQLQVTYEQKDQDIFVKGVKVFTLPKDPENNEWGVHYSVSSIQEIKPPDGRVFYYIRSDDGMARPNSYGESDDLVEVKDGKVIHHIQVYESLQYITSDVWRSTQCFSGAGLYVLTQHSISGKFKDMALSGAAMEVALKDKRTFKPMNEDIQHIGDMGDSAIFSIQCRDSKGNMTPVIRVYEVRRDGKVYEQNEKTKSLYGKLFVHDYKVYSIEQNGQVLRRLADGRSLYFGGSATDLGSFKKLKETAFKGKLPVYEYRKGKYICLEDLTLLGYGMKWDAKSRVGHWTYTGKKSGKPHVFKKTTIYDNDVYATFNGEYLHIYNCEGYSLVRLDDVEWRVKQ